MTRFLKRTSALIMIIFAFGCSTTPTARRVHLDVEWIRSTLKEDNYGFRRAERSAPLIDDGLVFVGNALDGFSAFDKKSGSLAWKMPIVNGSGSSPMADQEHIFFGASDGQFYSVNKKTGKPAWNFPTRSENLAQPLIADGVVYFLAGNNILYALDKQTGKQLWLYNRGDISSLSIRGGGRPTLYKGIIYEGFSDGFLVALNARDGALVWERKLNSNLKFVDVDATPVVDEDFIWVSSYDGALFCLSRGDGQIQWRLDEGGSVPVVIDGENLYFASLSQTIHALKKRSGVEIWKFSFEEKRGVPTQPILYKGMLIFGESDGDLIVLSQQTGKLLAHYRPGTGVFAAPAIDLETGMVYILSNEANLHALKLAWYRPEDEWGLLK